jgi:transposase-like protein
MKISYVSRKSLEKIRTTNMMERTNKELKTMSKMGRAFPNQESISR